MEILIRPPAYWHRHLSLTECKRVSYLPPEQLDRKPDSVGIPIPNEEVFVVDENGREVGSGKIGELIIRGSNVMQGYWNAPEETARTYRKGRYRGEVLLYSLSHFPNRPAGKSTKKDSRKVNERVALRIMYAASKGNIFQ